MKRIWSFSDNATTDIVLNSEALSLTCWLTSADFSVVFLFCFFFGRTSRLKSLITCVCSRISWTPLRPWPNPALLFKSDKPWCHPAVLAEVTALCGKCQLDMKSADFTGGKKYSYLRRVPHQVRIRSDSWGDLSAAQSGLTVSFLSALILLQRDGYYLGNVFVKWF